jgi:magnesium chelatase subunit I
MMRAARALAALDGSGQVSLAHIRDSAPLSLRHRLRRNPLDESGSTARIERAVEELLGA